MSSDHAVGFLLGFFIKLWLEVLKHRHEEVKGARTMMANARGMHAKASTMYSQGHRHMWKWSILLTTGWILFILGGMFLILRILH